MSSRKQKTDIDAVVRDLQDERYTTRDVAEKHNIPLKTVYTISYKRKVNLQNKVKPHHRRVIDAIKSRNLTRKEAAQQCNVSEGLVEYVCRKYSIKLRKPFRHPLLLDRDWLYKQLIEEQRTYREIAEMVGCTFQRVQQRVNELGWQNKRRRRKRRRQKG